MWKAQVVIIVILFHRITTSAFAKRPDIDRKDEIDIPFYRNDSFSIADKGGTGLISKGDFQFA